MEKKEVERNLEFRITIKRCTIEIFLNFFLSRLRLENRT